jgi:hypothetical protein
MMLDSALPSFIPPNGPAVSAVGAAGASIIFPGVIDIMGVGVGMAPPNIIGNPASGFFGTDMGLGIWKLDIQINIGVAFVTATSATGNFSIQGAPDTGAAGGYLPGTWEDFAETGPKAASELVAATVTGAGVFRMAMPPAPPATLTPRFYRMIMKVPTATDFTAGTITAAFMVQGRDDLQSAMRSASNYVVA